MKCKMPSLFVIMMDMVMMYVMMVMIVTTYQASALLAAELGFTRILTSGGAATALQVDDHLLHHHYNHHLHHHHHRHHENDQGAVTIADLVSELPDVNVMPGGGISEENMAEVVMIMMAMMMIMMVMAMVMVMIMIIVMAVIMTEMNMPEAFQRIVLMMKTMTSISSRFFEDINLLVIKMHDVKNSILKIPDHGGHKSSGVSRIGEVNFYKYKLANILAKCSKS